MINPRVFQFAVNSLQDRSFRSWITVIGIIVSIAVIFVLLTLSSGLQLAVVELFEDFGTNRLFIVPGGGIGSVGGLSASSFTNNEVDAVAALPYFEKVIPSIFRSAQPVTYQGTEAFVNIQGIPSDDADFVNAQYGFDDSLELGRGFREDESKVVILGYNVAFEKDDFFGEELRLRNKIELNGTRFEVIGIYEKVGGPDDSNVYIPLEDAREVMNRPDTVDLMDAIVKESVDINIAEARVDRLLERIKGEDTYEVIPPESLLRQFNSIIFIVQAVLLAIASISLLVGAIGIANTMFTSVLEREKEIGILKAVGARNRDVLQLFMFESGLIGLIGGIIGVILGIGVSFAIGAIAAAQGFDLLKITVNVWYVLFCLVFAFVIGVLSGFIPSYLASKKKIIDSLRDN